MIREVAAMNPRDQLRKLPCKRSSTSVEFSFAPKNDPSRWPEVARKVLGVDIKWPHLGAGAAKVTVLQNHEWNSEVREFTDPRSQGNPKELAQPLDYSLGVTKPSLCQIL